MNKTIKYIFLIIIALTVITQWSEIYSKDVNKISCEYQFEKNRSPQLVLLNNFSDYKLAISDVLLNDIKISLYDNNLKVKKVIKYNKEKINFKYETKIFEISSGKLGLYTFAEDFDNNKKKSGINIIIINPEGKILEKKFILGDFEFIGKNGDELVFWGWAQFSKNPISGLFGLDFNLEYKRLINEIPDYIYLNYRKYGLPIQFFIKSDAIILISQLEFKDLFNSEYFQNKKVISFSRENIFVYNNKDTTKKWELIQAIDLSIQSEKYSKIFFNKYYNSSLGDSFINADLIQISNNKLKKIEHAMIFEGSNGLFLEYKNIPTEFGDYILGTNDNSIYLTKSNKYSVEVIKIIYEEFINLINKS